MLGTHSAAPGGARRPRCASGGGPAPRGRGRGTARVPQEQGLEPTLRGLAIVEGLCTRPAQVPPGFLLHRRDVDRGQVPGAQQAGLCEGVPPVGCDPIPRPLGDQGGRDAPAALAFWGERAVGPRATWPRFRDQDEGGLLACRRRSSVSIAHGRVPLWPREPTAA